MHTILDKQPLGPDVWSYRFRVPDIAKNRSPGQFVILRIHEEGERIPVTIADADPLAGTITLIIQSVGKTTLQLSRMEVGDSIPDITGPLGMPTRIERRGTVLCVGGGIGVAPLYPVARGMKEVGNRVVSILGARSADLLILVEEMRGVSDRVVITTDDGSAGMRGLVTDAIRMLAGEGESFDECVAMGPPIMMKFVSRLTAELDVPTIVSLNPVMVDGTGMCGCCRVTVDGETRFACVDGPEFDGHKVDFDELMTRLATYRSEERLALDHYMGETGCRLASAVQGGGGR